MTKEQVIDLIKRLEDAATDISKGAGAANSAMLLTEAAETLHKLKEFLK